MKFISTLNFYTLYFLHFNFTLSLIQTNFRIHMIPVVFTYIVDDFPIVYTSKLYILRHCAVALLISYLFGSFIVFIECGFFRIISTHSGTWCTMLAELPALNIERIFLNQGEKKTSKTTALQTQALQNRSDSDEFKDEDDEDGDECDGGSDKKIYIPSQQQLAFPSFKTFFT